MQKSDSISELAKALSKCQAELQPAKFNAINPFLKNSYADLGAIIDAARKPMASNGLSVSQPVEISENTVGVTTILMHASGEWITSVAAMQMGEERGKSAAQVAGSIITYLRRYSLASILGIYADEDGDGNKPEAKTEKAKTTYTTQPEKMTTTSRAAEITQELGFEAVVTEAPKAAPKINGNGNGNGKIIDWLKQSGLAENDFAANGMLGLYNQPISTPEEKKSFMTWARNYRAWRDAGAESKAAAENAHAGVSPEA